MGFNCWKSLAKAGNICRSLHVSPKTRDRDYPRIHGEHEQDLKIKHLTTGPPPYARGTQINALNNIVADGAIPAYMGNTLFLDKTFDLF